MNKENMKMEILDLNNDEDTKTTDDKMCIRDS